MGDGRGRRAALVGGLTALVGLPIVVGLVALHGKQWLPQLDLAAMELRTRDVGGGDTPLVGPFARYEAQGVPGNHPGPIAYYLLAPAYRLLGGSAWAFLVSAAFSNVVAAGVAVWVGARRAGWQGALLVAAAVVLVARAYGIELMVSGWNVDVALLWWVVFGLAAWSLLCGDHVMAPVAALAGTICAQNHVSYGALVGAVGLVVLVVVVVRARAGWAAASPEARRCLLLWLGAGAVVGAVLWTPPVAQEIRNDPGNMTVIAQSFREPEPGEEQIRPRAAAELWLAHMNLDELVTADLEIDMERSPGPGSVVLLVSWLVAAAVAWRRRLPGLVELHLVVAVAAVAGFAAMSRITGPAFFYLTFWAWGTTALMLLATAWTVLSFRPGCGASRASWWGRLAAARLSVDRPAEPDRSTVGGSGRSLRPQTPAGQPGTQGSGDTGNSGGGAVTTGESRDGQVLPMVRPPYWAGGRVATGCVVAVAVLTAVVFTAEAGSPEMPDAEMARSLHQLVDQTVTALDDDPAGCGDDCRYLVTWSDPVSLGSHGVGMVAALEREGFEVGTPAYAERYVGDHRVWEPGTEDAVIHVALGDAAVDGAREDAGEQDRELAHVDLYTGEEREAQREQAEVVAGDLEEVGLGERAAEVREAPITDGLLGVGPDMPRALRNRVEELNAFVRPASVTLHMP